MKAHNYTKLLPESDTESEHGDILPSSSSVNDLSSISSGSSSTQESQPRRSLRINKGIPPNRYQANIHFSLIEPKSYNDAIESAEKNDWLIAMKDELAWFNKTWTLCKLPSERTAVGSKWVFNIKKMKMDR